MYRHLRWQVVYEVHHWFNVTFHHEPKYCSAMTWEEDISKTSMRSSVLTKTTPLHIYSIPGIPKDVVSTKYPIGSFVGIWLTSSFTLLMNWSLFHLWSGLIVPIRTVFKYSVCRLLTFSNTDYLHPSIRNIHHGIWCWQSDLPRVIGFGWDRRSSCRSTCLADGLASFWWIPAEYRKPNRSKSGGIEHDFSARNRMPSTSFVTRWFV